MRYLRKTKTCVCCFIILFSFGITHGQQQGGGGSQGPSVNAILNDLMNIEQSIAQFDEASGNGNQQGADTSGPRRGRNRNRDRNRNRNRNRNRQDVSGPSATPVDHHGGPDTATDPFSPGQHGADHHTGGGGRRGSRPRGPPVITDSHGNQPPPPTEVHVDLPFQHGNNNRFPVIHHGPAPISGSHSHTHTDVVSSQIQNPSVGSPARGNLGPSIVDTSNLNNAFNGLAVHQTPQQSLNREGGFVDLGRTPQDPSSIFPNGVFPLDQFPDPPIGSAIPATPVDIPLGSNSGVSTGIDPFGSTVLGSVPATSLGTPDRPVQLPRPASGPGVGHVDHVDAHHGGHPVGPEVHTPTVVNPPTEVVRSAVDAHAGTPHDNTHAHLGIHVDEPGRHGNNLNEAALHIPEGMTMKEIHESGILDAIAHDRATRQRGSATPDATRQGPSQPILPASPFGPIETGPVIPVDPVRPRGIDVSVVPAFVPQPPIEPVVPIGVPHDIDHVPVPRRGERRGRRWRNRMRRMRNRNRRRNRNRHRPAKEPVDVLIGKTVDPVPLAEEIPVPESHVPDLTSLKHSPSNPDHIHPGSGPVSLVPGPIVINGPLGPINPLPVGFGGHIQGIPGPTGYGRRVHGGPLFHRPGGLHHGPHGIHGGGGGGLMGDLMMTAAQVGAGGPLNAPHGTHKLFGGQGRRGRNNSVHITRSGPIPNNKKGKKHKHDKKKGKKEKKKNNNNSPQARFQDAARKATQQASRALLGILGGMMIG